MKPQERLIVALDLSTVDEAVDMVRRLEGLVQIFKVGLQLYTAAGPAVVEKIRSLGADVFLDLKLYDIPNTVGAAVTEAAKLGVRFLTVHTSGGATMLRWAREHAEEAAQRWGGRRLQLLGVTVLTSLDDRDLLVWGYTGPVDRLVVELARLARGTGIDGVVCSPLEVAKLREAELGDLLFVTPGIRPAGEAREDQKRVLTAAEAVRNGSDFLVVGRPIIRAADPRRAAEDILREIASALPAASQ